jgi:hypothetical protein
LEPVHTLDTITETIAPTAGYKPATRLMLIASMTFEYCFSGIDAAFSVLMLSGADAEWC